MRVKGQTRWGRARRGEGCQRGRAWLDQGAGGGGGGRGGIVNSARSEFIEARASTARGSRARS